MSPLLFASDAEGPNECDHGGYGVVITKASQHLVDRMYEVGHRSGRTITKLDGSVARLLDGEKELKKTIGVSRVPRALLELPAESWIRAASGRWRWPEHVMMGEARASLVVAEGCAVQPSLEGSITGILEDNEPWSAACAKGRSPTFRVNQLLRRKRVLEVATRQRYFLPWVDTRRQPADTLSRKR